MTDERHDGDDLPEGSVVIGGLASDPEARRPHFSILVAVLVMLLAGSLVVGLGKSGFMTSDDVVAQQTPGLATVIDFFEALSDGDAAEAERLIDPDFAVLQLPDPLGWDFAFQVTFNNLFQPSQSAEEISRHLSVLTVLQPDTSVGDCGSEVPDTPRGRALYDHFVTCQVRWQDGLRKNLNAPAVILTIEVGVRDDLIRGFFLKAPNDLVDPETATVDPVTGMFLSWLVQQHPAAAADVFLLTPWGDARGIRGPDTADELLGYSREFATWRDNLESTGTLPTPSVPPGRIEHSLVYRSSTGRVLLIGGRAGYGQGINDAWSFEADPGIWRPVGTFDLEPESAVIAAVRHPATDQILAVARNAFTSDVALWNLSRGSSIWAPIDLPPSEEGTCFDSPGLLPDPSSESFLIVLCSGGWGFDPTDGSWTSSPGLERAFYELVSPLVPNPWDNALAGRVATTLTPDLLIAAGAGQIRSLELPAGPVAVLETSGPAEVSAMAFDRRAGALIMIGDGELWSFDLENRELLQRLPVPAAGPSTGGMYWRSAAAAYDESSDTVVIFDGERTWTFDHGELSSHS